MGSSSKGKETVTMPQVLQEQTRLEEEAMEVLPFDITRCSKPLGQIRQSVYSCLTCNPIQSVNHQRAGVCSSCSVSCHTDHRLVELFVRRNFVCDCGTSRCNPNNCLLDHSYEARLNSNASEGLVNRYDKNFDGQFCICEKGQKYDPETETEDMYQCLACEDWRHASCLGPHPDSDEWDDLICADCVQNDPIISSIMFKYAGGDDTGMIVCAKSEHTQVICYGKLSSTSNPECSDQPAGLDPSSAEEDAPELQADDNNQPQTQLSSSLLHNQNSTKNPPNRDENSNHVHQEKQVSDPSIDSSSTAEKKEGGGAINGSHKDCASQHHSDQEENQRGNLLSSNFKRSPSPSFGNDKDKKTDKKPKLEETNHMTSTTSKFEELNSKDSKAFLSNDQDDHRKTSPCCKAPFKNRSQSILNQIDPKFSNVYLMYGWRNRWCNCLHCHVILSKLNWLIHEEEEVWEPGEDTDSLKSIHELGLEALKNLPRAQLVDGIMAYNQFKKEFLDFLKPFHSSNKLITELDIHEFFQNIKSQISKN